MIPSVLIQRFRQLRMLISLFKDRSHLRARRNRAEERVVFDIRSGELLKRHLFSIAYCLHLVGIRIDWRPRLRFLLRNTEELDETLLRLPFFRFRMFGDAGRLLRKEGDPIAILTDIPGVPNRGGAGKPAMCRVSELEPGRGLRDHEFMPQLTIGPRYLFSESPSGAGISSPLPLDQMDHRLIFFGNCAPEHHKRPSSLDKLGVIRRPRLVELLRLRFGDETEVISTWEQQERYRQSGSPKAIVIFDASGAGLFGAEYWHALSRSAFFLAMPGMDSLHTHSLAEAMSAGCCPLLQSEVRVCDAFKKDVNCVSFSGEPGFESAVRFVLSAGPDQLVRLREAAFKLYEARFSPRAVGEGVSAALRSGREIKVNHRIR